MGVRWLLGERRRGENSFTNGCLPENEVFLGPEACMKMSGKNGEPSSNTMFFVCGGGVVIPETRGRLREGSVTIRKFCYTGGLGGTHEGLYIAS